MNMGKIAGWTFMAFIIIAIVMGLAVGYMEYKSYSALSNTDAAVTLILLILGIIVGFVSVTAKDVTPFLIAAIALIVATTSVFSNVWTPLSTIHPLLYDWAKDILKYIAAFAAPAAVIIAIKALYAMEEAK